MGHYRCDLACSECGEVSCICPCEKCGGRGWRGCFCPEPSPKEQLESWIEAIKFARRLDDKTDSLNKTYSRKKRK